MTNPEGTDLERLSELARNVRRSPVDQADFIAACSPSTIIALIARCLAAEKERDAQRDLAMYLDRQIMGHQYTAGRLSKAESALAQAIAERDRMAAQITILNEELRLERAMIPDNMLRASQALTTTTEQEG